MTEYTDLMDIDDDVTIGHINLTIATLRKAEPLDLACVSPGGKEIPSASTDTSLANVSGVLVLDTNYLLSQLAFVKKLVEAARTCTSGQIRLIIPWVVVQELDGLKNSKKTVKVPCSTTAVGLGKQNDRADIAGTLSKPSSCLEATTTLGRLARTAMNFIYDYLQTGDDGSSPNVVRGQKMTEKLPMNTNCNDDLILSCCRFFLEVVHIPGVALLSLDKALAVKAMIHQVRSFGTWKQSPQRMLESLLGNSGPPATQVEVDSPAIFQEYTASSQLTEKYDSDDAMMIDDDYNDPPVTTVANHQHTFSFSFNPAPFSLPPVVTQPALTSPNPTVTSPPPIHSKTPFKHLENIVHYLEDTEKSILIHAIRIQFGHHLGEAWDYAVYGFIQPPWDLYDICNLIQHFWFTVFRDVYPAPAYGVFQSIKQRYKVWQELLCRGGSTFNPSTTASKSDGHDTVSFVMQRDSPIGNSTFLKDKALDKLRTSPDSPTWRQNLPRLDKVDQDELEWYLLSSTGLERFYSDMDVLLIICDEAQRLIRESQWPPARLVRDSHSRNWVQQVIEVIESPTSVTPAQLRERWGKLLRNK
ncbi:hypothetical protein IWQ61_004181 [Dispira simplex]|nr:hypothetical protein IWQ61_004181 [Dispira simplex]